MAVTGEGDHAVHGGAHGVEADMDDMDATGGTIRSTGADVVDIAVASHRFLVDPNLLSSALLSPGTFATFEAEMVAALDGPNALSAHGVKMTAAGLFMQGMANAYLATDQALAWADDAWQWTEGFLGPIGLFTPVGPPLAALTAFDLYQQGLFDDPQKWLLEHPEELEDLVASSPGFVALLSTLAPSWAQPLIGFPLTVEQGSSILAGLYGQELESVTDVDTQTDVTPPADIAGALRRVADAGAETDQFQIEVVDGVVNVYLPGTKEFDSPLDESGVVQNMGTNLAAVAGGSNAYQQAVIQALEEMDLPPGTEINLVGHSQGGIVAARLAESIANGETDIEGSVGTVITAGSPVDGIELPPEVQMVSLANEYDIVPRLDGEGYGDKSNHTTIVGYDQNGSVGENHGIDDVYFPMAEGLVDSDDPAVVDALSGINLGGGSGTLTTYQMERG